MKIVVFDIGGDALPEVFIGNLGENLLWRRAVQGDAALQNKLDVACDVGIRELPVEHITVEIRVMQSLFDALAPEIAVMEHAVTGRSPRLHVAKLHGGELHGARTAVDFEQILCDFELRFDCERVLYNDQNVQIAGCGLKRAEGNRAVQIHADKALPRVRFPAFRDAGKLCFDFGRQGFVG